VALLIYRIIWLLLSPLVFTWSVHQMIARRGGLGYLLERSGLTQRNEHATPVWFHVASVGEMRLATPMITAVLERGLLITCNTPEAYRLAASTWGNSVTLRYCPLDYRSFVKRFIGRYTPSVVFIIETEIWPELYEQCHQQNIAIYIVNGRISDKTLRSRLARAWLYPMALRRISGVWAREDEDASRFAAMGCPPDKICTTGSIKMTRRLHSSVPENPLPHRQFALAISTHSGEETAIADAWRSAAGNNLLVLIPRHPPRASGVARSLASRGIVAAQKSVSGDLSLAEQVLVVDAIGQVDAYCAHASFVFVGGSLVDAGGHNVFEPASWGKAMIVGPHTQNFSAEVDYLSAHGAINIVQTTEALNETWHRLTHDLAFRTHCETNARDAHAALPDRINDYIGLVDAAVSIHT
jgi:3-deoxy-D-manno-octulosonic-acid transferase